MGRRCFSFSCFRRRTSHRSPELPLSDLPPAGGTGGIGGGAAAAVKGKKKAGARLWIRFDRLGNSELIECDKNAIIRRAAIPARDLRILGPVFSQSSNILGEEICNL